MEDDGVDNHIRSTHVKWAGPNTPYIRVNRTDERLYLTKRELVGLMHEIESFVHYYREDFTEERIDYKDDDTWMTTTEKI